MTDQPISLEEIRLRLNELDDQLLSLLSERRKLSIEVAKSKVQTSKPVRDAVREQQLLVKLISNGRDKYELDAQYITKLFHTIIEDSVLLQQGICKTLLTRNKAASHLHASLSWEPKVLTRTWQAANISVVKIPSLSS